jgi:aspartokinase/homoserine dehydrogenase 1
MRYQPGIAGRLFQALGNNGVNVVAIAQGSSELNISVVLNREDETKALNVLHEAFFLSETTELNLFIVGTGLIGNTLLEQIRRQKAYLQREHAIELRVVGLCNSKKMLLREQGIQIDHWKEDLDHCDFGMNIDEFITRMKRMNLPNTIFVDNTASEEIASRYAAILEGSISISTPNKIATSSSFDQYRMLKTIARQRGVLFQYETNVGAGLPIISTLNDLILSGDNILKIEGVISGSLSYIFNNFVPGKRFSEVVREAQLKGFTEPDPRIDLFGLDMRRKLIILARETGLTLEAEEVRMQSWLPQPCINAYDVATFFKALEKADGYFEQMLEAATGEGRVLRMAAVLEGSEAGIHLITVGSDHPFYHLDGSDNMIVFTTTRYKDRPLVVRGPGAGAEVTAAGIFAEIIKIGNSL